MNRDRDLVAAPMRVLQIGIGDWGLNWASNVIPKVHGIDVVGYVSRSEDRIARARSNLNLSNSLFFPSIEVAVEKTQIDAVLILTTTASHQELIERSLQLGKHVLVEKPFVEDLHQGKKLAKLAADNNLTLMVAQNFRYYPAAQKASEIVETGTLGRLGEIAISFRKCLDFDNKERADWHYHMVQPLIVDMGIHHFDLLRMVTGSEAQSVVASAPDLAWSPYRDPASVSALIRFDNGIVANWHGSWISRSPHTTFSGDWRMEFEGGAVDWASRGDRDNSLSGERLVVRKLGQHQAKYDLPKPKIFGRSGVLEDFRDAVLEGQFSIHAPTASDNVSSLAIADAVLESVLKGTRVTISSP